MKFTTATVAGAMAGLVAGQAAFTNTNYNLEAGSPFTLTWTGANSDAVNILLKSGDSGNLKDVETLDSAETGSQYVFTPPSSLCSNEVYAFAIVDGSGINYSPQFSISGLSPCTLTTSSSGMTSSTMTSSTLASSMGSSSSSSSSSTSNSPSSSPTGASVTSITTPLSNYTATVSASSTTLSTAKVTSPATQTTSPITNTNNGQRASYSLFAILLVTVAGLLCVN